MSVARAVGVFVVVVAVAIAAAMFVRSTPSSAPSLVPTTTPPPSTAAPPAPPPPPPAPLPAPTVSLPSPTSTRPATSTLPPLPSPPVALRPDRRRAPLGLTREARAVVRAAIDHYIATHGLEAGVTEIDRRLLVLAFERTRRSTQRQQMARREMPGLARRNERVNAAADRFFRDRLGVGIDEFVAAEGLDRQLAEPGTGR